MGTTVDLMSPEFAADPYPAYAHLRDMDHLHFDESTRSYVVSRHDEAVAAFRDPRFSTRNYEWQLEPVHGRTILQLDGTEHSTRRARLNPFLRGDGLRRWEPFMTALATQVVDDLSVRGSERLVAGLAGGEPFDLVTGFAQVYPIDIIGEMLGLPRSDRATFRRWYLAVVAFLSNLAGDPDVHAAGVAVRQELADYLTPLVHERRGGDGPDLVTLLARDLPDAEVLAFVSLLLTAGGETTDKTFASTVRNLLASRDQWRAVCADPSLVDRAVAETLRFSPPTHMTMRQLVDDVEVRGTRMPAGATVIVLNASANRDERRFAHADRFDLFRDDLAFDRAFSGAADHVAFGGGRHFCVGSQLARTELTMALTTLTTRFPDLRLAPGATPTEVGVKTRGLSSLWCVAA